MAKFKILVEETLTRTIEVEAKDYATARQKVKNDYYSEKIVLDSDDFCCVEFNESNE